MVCLKKCIFFVAIIQFGCHYLDREGAEGGWDD